MDVWLGLSLLLGTVSLGSAETIRGSITPCSNEGEPVNVDYIKNIRCYTCMCKNGFVECLKEYCPSQDGCHMLLDMPKGTCCRRCKGCLHQGVQRESGEEWHDWRDPCKVYTCKAGIITETHQKCYTPCSNPSPPDHGQCCPTCKGCLLNGQVVSEEMRVRPLEDPCLRCHCGGGRLVCYKRACPVLNCLPGDKVTRPGHCCPSCTGSRRLIEPPQGRCLLGANLYNPERKFLPDLCTSCHCTNGTSLCHRPTCPPLDCPPEAQTVRPGHCCPYCINSIETKPTCNHNGIIYNDGEGWNVDQCKSCMCKKGQIKCAVQECAESNIPCPPNHKLTKLPGQCCPKCLESDGICTVFGDPHYKTFDGKFFSFQGSCKYQLTADCVDNSFSIRVTNDARETKTSSWTKTVSMKIGGWKVNLGERRRVKLNGSKVLVPYRSHLVNVTNADDSVLVETQLGIKVLWDGNSFLEVSVPPKYKGKLCGLCGNFNGVSRDDILSRRGRPLLDGDKLGASWRVGGRKACTRLGTPKHCAFHRRAQTKLCKPLSSTVFAPCHNRLNYSIYLKSCLVDMCECPSRKCYCESFTAYAHECKRLGVDLPNWKLDTGCLQARH